MRVGRLNQPEQAQERLNGKPMDAPGPGNVCVMSSRHSTAMLVVREREHKFVSVSLRVAHIL